MKNLYVAIFSCFIFVMALWKTIIVTNAKSVFETKIMMMMMMMTVIMVVVVVMIR